VPSQILELLAQSCVVLALQAQDPPETLQEVHFEQVSAVPLSMQVVFTPVIG
jgi:hypothetical protein